MLVLARKEGENIALGDDITITVVRISGDQIRLGIDAPREVLVLRGELLEKQQQQEDTPDIRPYPGNVQRRAA